ncbi:uncharacterized protein EV154DRAFT_269738 [Mucor mucedo]|uniref:uncharacterized protein n=1 Tax=Mucor mucedo TaxID=29922 RepID=UPI00221EF342|nr:uncharacterized protein EV154DRAFT_269738 [Mucor mucedo]KAI7889790.1 hypothetical protein EV154DRAFT_269738 [Mucor mucedo]
MHLVNANERTPLIQSPQKPNIKKTIHVYGTTIGFLFLFSLVIHWYRTCLPTPLSDVQAKVVDDFSGIHAYNEYLSHFVAPHSANTRENGVMRDWIASVATSLQEDAISRGLKIDVIGNDPSKDVFAQDWFTPNEHWFIESRNVMIRLHGQSGRDEALLINAHYDSVPTSNGVTDNGMGVVTTIELLRYFIQNPPRHTIIFLLNNFEEGGLIGAKSFIKHPWYSSVKLFINLEGAGAGGRALMFRCSNLNAVKKLANSNAAFKHASPLGNDMFKAQLLKSDTDYSIFTETGVPGLDIAFYAPRSHYHTPLDNLANTTPEALQHMGQLALAAVKGIANSDDMLETPKEQESFIYFDILGRFMFAYSLTTFQIINMLALLAVPGTSVYMSMRQNQGKTTSEVLLEKLELTAQGLLAVFSALILMILLTVIAVYSMSLINPSMTYGDVYGAAIYCFVTAFLGLQLSQLILPKKLKQTLVSTDAAWYGLMAFWWIFVAFSSFAGSKGVAGLCFAVYVLAFNSSSVLLHNLLPSTQKFRSPFIFFLQTLVPFVFLLEIDLLVMDAMRHATADGTPEIAVYILIALPLILIAIHFLPWIYVAGNQRQSTLGALVAFVFIFTICSALQPFNGTWSPNKLVFSQVYNAGEALATVTVFTATGVQSTLKAALPAHEYSTMQCEPFKKFLTRCTYQTDLLPKYGSNATLGEVELSEVLKICDDFKCKSTATYKSKNSLMCRLYFDPIENQPIQQAWVNDEEIKSQNISAILSYVDRYEQEVTFSVEYPVTAPEPKATLGCFYDEWIHHEIPAFTTLRDNLPGHAVLLIRGQGLALVNYMNVTL